MIFSHFVRSGAFGSAEPCCITKYPRSSKTQRYILIESFRPEPIPFNDTNLNHILTNLEQLCGFPLSYFSARFRNALSVKLADGDLRVWADRPFWSTHKEPPAKTRPEVIAFQRKQFAAQLDDALVRRDQQPLIVEFR